MRGSVGVASGGPRGPASQCSTQPHRDGWYERCPSHSQACGRSSSVSTHSPRWRAAVMHATRPPWAATRWTAEQTPDAVYTPRRARTSAPASSCRRSCGRLTPARRSDAGVKIPGMVEHMPTTLTATSRLWGPSPGFVDGSGNSVACGQRDERTQLQGRAGDTPDARPRSRRVARDPLQCGLAGRTGAGAGRGAAPDQPKRPET